MKHVYSTHVSTGLPGLPGLARTIAVTAAVLALIALAAGPVYSQSNEILDRILAEEELVYGSAAYLLLLASDSIGDDATLASAAEALSRSGMGLENRNAGDPITLGEYALLTMRVFTIPGGIAWSIYQAPRYATRELEFRGVIQGQAYPGMSLSGERAMRILGRVLNLREGGAL